MILRGKCLLDTLDKRCDRYISAIVLGLNDALVEMTGALAGFTMALHDNRLIALAGLTTGVAATLSMAASEFLAKKADPAARHPYTAAIYTGATYLITVALLLLPFFMLDDPFTSLACCLLTAASIITMFTWAVARLRQKPFLGNCLQMLSISFSVSAIAFGISWAARYFWDLKGNVKTGQLPHVHGEAAWITAVILLWLLYGVCLIFFIIAGDDFVHHPQVPLWF